MQYALLWLVEARKKVNITHLKLPHIQILAGADTHLAMRVVPHFLSLSACSSGEEAPKQRWISQYRSENFTVLLRDRNHGATLHLITPLGLSELTALLPGQHIWARLSTISLLVYKQWGVAENTSVSSGHAGTYSTSFPIAFNLVYQIVCSTVKAAQSNKGAPNIYSYTTSTVTFSTYDGGYVDKAMYIAVGK